MANIRWNKTKKLRPRDYEAPPGFFPGEKGNIGKIVIVAERLVPRGEVGFAQIYLDTENGLVPFYRNTTSVRRHLTFQWGSGMAEGNSRGTDNDDGVTFITPNGLFSYFVVGVDAPDELYINVTVTNQKAHDSYRTAHHKIRVIDMPGPVPY